MFGAFTEGMALFASFAMLLNFPRHNKMNGMGQIVSWSVRDESLHCEGVIKLFHEWNRGDRRGHAAVRDDIIDVAKTMVRLEENFVDLAFGIGDIEGMRPERNQVLCPLHRRLAADATETGAGVRHISKRPRAATSR